MMISRQTDDTLISKTDMGLVGEILFARMDALKTAIQPTRHPLFDAEMLMEQVQDLRRSFQRHRQGNRTQARRRMGQAPAGRARR